MSPGSFKVLLSTAEDLLQEGQLELCVGVLLKAKLGVEDESEWGRVWPLLERLPDEFLHTNPNAALLYVRALRCTRRRELAVEWALQHRPDPTLPG